jgi:hypothetical protein
MLQEIVFCREDLAERSNCNYEEIRKQQKEATTTSFLRKEDSKG